MLLDNFHTDITIPYFIAVILEAEIALLVVTATVLEQLECQGPVLLTELAALQQVDPFLAPQLVAEHLHTVLVVGYLAVLHGNLHFVPFAGMH